MEKHTSTTPANADRQSVSEPASQPASVLFYCKVFAIFAAVLGLIWFVDRAVSGQ